MREHILAQYAHRTTLSAEINSKTDSDDIITESIESSAYERTLDKETITLTVETSAYDMYYEDWPDGETRSIEESRPQRFART